MPLYLGTDDQGTQASSLQDFAPTSSQKMDAAVRDTWLESPGPTWLNNIMGMADDTRRITAAEAESYARDYGGGAVMRIKPRDNEYTIGQWSQIVERQRELAAVKDVRERTPWEFGSILRGAAMFGTAMLDPVNIATAFVPWTRSISALRGVAATAETGATFGARTGARAVLGAADAGISTAALEPLYFAGRQALGDDYDYYDSLANIAFGAAFGGVVAPGAGAIGDAFRARAGRADVPKVPEAERVGNAPEQPATAPLEGVPVSREVVDRIEAPSSRAAEIEAQMATVRNDLMATLRDRGGIAPNLAREIGGEGAQRVNRMLPGVVRQDGVRELDQLAEQLADAGYLPPGVDPGSAEAASMAEDMLARALNGERVLSVEQQIQEAELRAARMADEEDALRFEAEIEARLEREAIQFADTPAAAELVRQVEPETREAMLRTAVAQAVDGREVDVDAVFGTDPNIGDRTEADLIAAADRNFSPEAQPLADFQASADVDARIAAAPKRLDLQAAEQALADADALLADVVRAGDEAFRYSRGEPVTETEAFKRWFGESKVVDGEGRPLVVYHGTRGDFSKFDIGHFGKTDAGWAGEAFYFSPDASEASNYASFVSQYGQPSGAANVMPVYISAKNPLDWVLGSPESSRIQEARNSLGSAGFAKWVTDQGYDSVHITSRFGENQWAVYSPTQIKSAIGNRGTFDPANPDILYARGLTGSTAADVLTTSVRNSFGDSTDALLARGQIQIVGTPADIPGGPHPLDVKAATAPDGTVYVVAENVSEAEARGIVLHEVGVHVGMQDMLGPEVFDDVLRQLDDAITRGEDWAQAARAGVPADTPAGLVREEQLAYLVQNSPELPIVQRIIAAVRAWAFRTFKAARERMTLTEADFRAMAVSALHHAARTDRMAGEVVPAFLRDVPQTEEQSLDRLKKAMAGGFATQDERRVALLSYLEAFVSRKRAEAPIKLFESSYFNGSAKDTDRGVARYVQKYRDELPTDVMDALSLENVRDLETGETLNAVVDGVRGGHIGQLRNFADPGVYSREQQVDLPNGWFVEEGQKGLAKGKFRIVGEDGVSVGNWSDTPELAVNDARKNSATRAVFEKEREKVAAAYAEVRRKIANGLSLTQADMQSIGLKQTARLDYLSPRIQSVFGIPSRKVRDAIGSTIKQGQGPFGGAIFEADTMSAFAAAKKWADANNSPEASHPIRYSRGPIPEQGTTVEQEIARYDRAVQRAKAYAGVLRAAADKLDNDAQAVAAMRAAMPDITEVEIADLLAGLRKQVAGMRGAVRSMRDAVTAEDRAAGSQFDAMQAADTLANNLEMAAVIEKRNAALNVAARMRIGSFVGQFRSAKLDFEGFRALLVGSERKREGGRLSVDAEQKAFRGQWLGGLIADMERGGLMKLFRSGQFDREVSQALWNLGRDGVGNENLPPEAVRMAEIINKYQTDARNTRNRFGAWIRDLQGYIARQSHDMFRIREAGEQEWIRTVLPLLDIPKMQRLGLISETDLEGSLRFIYDDFAAGSHLKTPAAEDDLAAFGSGASLARRESASRVLYFKDGNAAHEYNVRFGNGRLAEQVLAGLDNAARSAGLLKVLGTNPADTVQRAFLEYAETLRGDPERRAKFLQKRGELDNLLAQIDGSVNIPGSFTAARITAFSRAWISMAKLGGALISSITDLANYGAEMRFGQDRSLFGGVLDGIGALARGRAKGERRDVLASLGVFHESTLGAVFARFDSPDLLGGKTSAAMQMFFKLNGLNWWTESLRDGYALSHSHYMARNASKAWDALPEALRDMLSLYRIDAGKWELLRLAPLKMADGRQYMTPDGLRTVPVERMAEYIRSTGRQVNDATILNLQADLSNALRAMTIDRMHHAVIEPSARTRAFMLRGTQPGTVPGEFLRYVGQFKSFPVALIQSTLGREVYGRGYDTIGQFLRASVTTGKGAGDMAQIATFIALSTAMGYAAMSAKDLLRGRNPRPIDDRRTWMAAFVQGGGLGIYGDFLFGQYNRMGSSLVGSLAGPVAGVGDTVADLWTRIRNGDDVAAASFNAVLSNTPFMNLFYTRAALDYLILYEIQEALNPGYLRRMERRAQTEFGQTYYLPPSQVVR